MSCIALEHWSRHSSLCCLQLCHAACLARQWMEVCSLLITPSAQGWPTSATTATGSPPKSWLPPSASQTAPGATSTRYPDALVSRAGRRGRRGVEEEGEWWRVRGIKVSARRPVERRSWEMRTEINYGEYSHFTFLAVVSETQREL